MTLRQIVSQVKQQLDLIPDLAPSASRDAVLLVLKSLSLPSTLIYTDPARPISQPEQERVAEALQRRLTGEPIQYIFGTQEFFGLLLAVTPAVLIPRPETELLVEAAIHRLPTDRPVTLADVGTGSGAIAIAMAVHCPQAHILALDVSPAALGIAAQNASTHGVADRITFVESDLLGGWPPSSLSLDAVLANLPYISLADSPTLHRQVSGFEPHVALFAPQLPAAHASNTDVLPADLERDDGLSLYRRLLPQAWTSLRPGGLLAMELGAGQQRGLEELLQGWQAVQFLSDLQAIPRVALARTPETLPPSASAK